MRAVPALAALALLLPPCVTAPAAAAAAPLALPDAPVVLRITDVGAFDRAMSGGLRKAVSGKLPASDPAGAAWRRTRVGGKLEAQWELFAADLPLSWPDVLALKPTEIGFALLSAGDLEAVLAVRTPLAALPIRLPAGTQRTHGGIAWHFVSRGAGDLRTLDRRMGLAWARTADALLIATSERAMLLALDAAPAAGAPPVQGFALLRLDMDRLGKDRYFRREFLFAEGRTAKGVVNAALRMDGDTLVEVRDGDCGSCPDGAPAARWPIEGRSLSAAGWESDGARFLPALRRAFLEPLPGDPAPRPVRPAKAIPSADGSADDRYLVDMTRPSAEAAAAGEGEIPAWTKFVRDAAIGGWGWEIAESGAVRLVLLEPQAFDAPFLDLAATTLRRRSGCVTRDPGLIRVGPGLAGLAVRRTGGALWVASRPEDLEGVPEPKPEAGLVRWGRAEPSLLKGQARVWAEAEGTLSPDTTRPFSDRVLGLLGWAPTLRSVSVERRRSGSRYEEKVVFSFAKPAAPPSPGKTAAPAKGPAKKAPKKT